MVSDVSVNSRPEAKQVDRATTNYRVGACEDSVSLQLLPLPCHNIPQHILKGRLRGLPVLFPIGDGAGFIRALRRYPMPTTQCAHHWIIETADSPVSKGECQLCGEEREFSNSAGFMATNWNSDPAISRASQSAEAEVKE